MQEKFLPSNSPEASCLGKQSFESWALANAVGGRKTRRAHGSMKPYHCTCCGRFHLSTPRRAPVPVPPSKRKTGGFRG